MDKLIAELEAAPEGSATLDVDIHAHATGDLKVPIPPYSTSLDAALTLVPEGLCWEVEAGPKTGGVADIGTAHGPMEGIAATPALALCIAALRARQTMKDVV